MKQNSQDATILMIIEACDEPNQSFSYKISQASTNKNFLAVYLIVAILGAVLTTLDRMLRGMALVEGMR